MTIKISIYWNQIDLSLLYKHEMYICHNDRKPKDKKVHFSDEISTIKINAQ